METKRSYYKERKRARGDLYEFVKAWRPKLRKMGLSLLVEQSDVLCETANVILSQRRMQGADLTIGVGRDGGYEGIVRRRHGKASTDFTAEILGAPTLDAFLTTAQEAWVEGACETLSFSR